MEVIIAVAFLVTQIVRVLLNQRTAAETQKTQPLCNDCASAHVQVDGKGRTTIFCTFGGGVRPVKADVVFCTDFRKLCAGSPGPGRFCTTISLAEPEAEAAITGR